jgi:hypothetical protein
MPPQWVDPSWTQTCTQDAQINSSTRLSAATFSVNFVWSLFVADPQAVVYLPRLQEDVNMAVTD